MTVLVRGSITLGLVWLLVACGREPVAPWSALSGLLLPSAGEVHRGEVRPETYIVRTPAGVVREDLVLAGGTVRWLGSGSDGEALWQMKFGAEQPAREILPELHDAGLVLGAEPDRVSRVRAGEDSWEELALAYGALTAGTGLGSTSPAFWLDQIALTEALQDLSQRGLPLNEGPVIAVLDSGVDTEHPGLRGRMWNNPGIDAGCGSGSGCNVTVARKDDLGDERVWPIGTGGPDRYCRATGLRQNCEHGTRVAGILAGQAGGGWGGVCPSCRILPVRIVSAEAGTILDSSIVAALNYLLNLKAAGVPVRVVNASFGKFRRSQTVTRLIHRLRREHGGALVVAAAGNENTQDAQYPAALDDVLAVANVDSVTGLRHSTSNFGDWVDIAAPGAGPCGGNGAGILSAVPGGLEGCARGTSFSAPVVAGVAGLLLTAEPQLSIDQLEQRLTTTADPSLYNLDGNRAFLGQDGARAMLGAGIVSAAGALKNGAGEGITRPAADRIRRGCGVLGGPGTAGPLTVILYLLPLLAGCLTRRRRT